MGIIRLGEGAESMQINKIMWRYSTPSPVLPLARGRESSSTRLGQVPSPRRGGLGWGKHAYIISLIFLLTTIFGGFIVHAQEGESLVPVVVARQPIPRGTVLIPENLYGDNPLVEVQFWQPEFAPRTAYRRIEDVEGLVAKIDLTTRMPLLAGNLTTDATLTAPIGSDTALVMPFNRRGVPLRVENLYTAPPTLTELECVDVIAVFQFGREELQTRFIVGRGGTVVENIAGSGRVTVALEPEAAVIAVWMQDNGIPLALEYCPITPSG